MEDKSNNPVNVEASLRSEAERVAHELQTDAKIQALEIREKALRAASQLHEEAEERTNSRGRTFTDELALALIERLQNAGHICVHEKDIARLITVADRLEKTADKTDSTVDKIEDKVAANIIDIVKIKTERRTYEKIVTFLAGSGVLAALYTLWGKLFSSTHIVNP